MTEEQGFTLPEVLAVIVIAAVLAAVLVPSFGADPAGNRSRVAAQALAGADELAQSDFEQHPTFDGFDPSAETAPAFRAFTWTTTGPLQAGVSAPHRILIASASGQKLALCNTTGTYALCVTQSGAKVSWGASTDTTAQALANSSQGSAMAAIDACGRSC